MRDCTVSIAGRRWRIKFLPPSRMATDEHGRPLDGRCDWESKTITICKQDQNVMIETLLHELKHPSCPILYEAEEFVTAQARLEREALERTRLI